MLHDIVLEGHGVRLRPLELADAAQLATFVDRGVWAHMPPPFPDGVGGWTASIEKAIVSYDRMPFAVTHAATGDVLGSTSFYELSEAQRRVEIGHTFYGRASWVGT